MDSTQWDNLKKDKPRAKKLMQQAGVPGILLQLRWGSLSKAQRKKIEKASKGKGWFEEKEEVVTAKGTETKAPKHRKVALKAHGDGAINEPIRTESGILNKRVERKEPGASKKPKKEKLSERRYKEWYDKGFAEAGKNDSIYKDVKSVEEDIEMVKESNRTPAPEVYAGIPNLSGLESLAKLEGIRDGLIAKAKKAQEQKEACVDSSGKEYAIAFLRKNPIPLSDIEYYKGRALNRHNPHAISDLVWQKAWNKVGMDGEIMILDSKGDIYLTPYYVDEVMVNRKYVKEGQPEETMLKRMGEKEPWQMVKQEWLDTNLSKEGQQSKKKKIGNRTLKEWKLGEHRNYVEQAIRDHKPVPEKVLAEYPELTKKDTPSLATGQIIEGFDPKGRGHWRKIGKITKIENDKVFFYNSSNPEEYQYYDHTISDVTKWLSTGEYRIKKGAEKWAEKGEITLLEPHQPEMPQGIKPTNEEEQFVRGIYKQVSDGATVKEFGTRLYVWKDNEANATKHITDSEYMALKAIIKGVHQLSRADALKNLKEGRDKGAKIAQEIEERKAQEAGMTTSKLKDKMSELNKVYNNFRQKYGRSGVKKETQRQALVDFERLGREIADDMAKQLGFNNLDEVPDFGLRNKLGNLYDPNTFMEDTDRFLKQIEIKIKEAKLPVKGMAGQGV